MRLIFYVSQRCGCVGKYWMWHIPGWLDELTFLPQQTLALVQLLPVASVWSCLTRYWGETTKLWLASAQLVEERSGEDVVLG